MFVERTVHIGGACLIMIRLLAFPVQLFLLMEVNFSLVFLSSILTYRISQSQLLGLSDMVTEQAEQDGEKE